MALREDQERRMQACKEAKWNGRPDRPPVGYLTGSQAYSDGFSAGCEHEEVYQRARYERLVKAAEAILKSGGTRGFDDLRAALADLREPEGGGDG